MSLLRRRSSARPSASASAFSRCTSLSSDALYFSVARLSASICSAICCRSASVRRPASSCRQAGNCRRQGRRVDAGLPLLANQAGLGPALVQRSCTPDTSSEHPLPSNRGISRICTSLLLRCCTAPALNTPAPMNSTVPPLAPAAAPAQHCARAASRARSPPACVPAHLGTAPAGPSAAHPAASPCAAPPI